MLQVKPYKLKPSTDTNITRDDFVTWKYNIQASIRQKDAWLKFMTGGSHCQWTSQDDDPTRGLSVPVVPPLDIYDRVAQATAGQAAQNASVKLRGDHDDFLACVATFCPAGFYEFVIRESTSIQWIFDQILSTYNLQTKRQEILNGCDVSFTFTDKFTYQHGYIQLKDFYMSALLPAGAVWKGKTLLSAETLSPLAESLIIEKWLLKIHPGLPAHLKKTRGHLFNDRSPTLGCNQAEICKQIDVMLGEMDKDPANVGRYVPTRPRPNNSYRPTGYSYPRPSYRPHVPFRQPWRPAAPQGQPTRPPPSQYPCSLCLQAGKPESVARTHSYANCQQV